MGNRKGIDLYTTMNGQQAAIETAVPSDPVGSYSRLIENFVGYTGRRPEREDHQAGRGADRRAHRGRHHALRGERARS